MGGQNHVPIPLWGTEPCPQGRPHPDPRTLRLCDVPRQRGWQLWPREGPWLGRWPGFSRWSSVITEVPIRGRGPFDREMLGFRLWGWKDRTLRTAAASRSWERPQILRWSCSRRNQPCGQPDLSALAFKTLRQHIFL